jgi:hypothetical protein
MVAIVLTTTSVDANVITRCGASKGYAFFFEGPFIDRKNSGWTEDGISKGGLQLFQSGPDYDVMVTDTLGTKSMRGDGFTVIRIPQPKPEYTMIIATHAETGVVEHYLFKLDPTGAGTVAWGSLKGGGSPFPKSSLLVAACMRP